MKRNVFIVLFVFIVGCTNDAEYAGSNILKGDSFFAKGEYEIAEYYYDKVPEESPYYNKAQRRLAEIKKKKDVEVALSATSQTKENVSVVSHSFQINNFGRVPFHSVVFANDTKKATQIIELEFVYFDGSGKEVARLATMLNVSIPPNGRREVEKISPGMVNEKFDRVSVLIQRVLFE